uniref:Murein DD-endopeptidase MepM n=1 Tax=Candidatus Aschnera chinzeii TaxID=1485666 RepID=A0AAT9G4X7_9ENTR|nr:MAG: hypothetical protein ACHINZ_4370 [Candidatus Aschnera chinzeii]
MQKIIKNIFNLLNIFFIKKLIILIIYSILITLIYNYTNILVKIKNNYLNIINYIKNTYVIYKNIYILKINFNCLFDYIFNMYNIRSYIYKPENIFDEIIKTYITNQLIIIDNIFPLLHKKHINLQHKYNNNKLIIYNNTILPNIHFSNHLKTFNTTFQKNNYYSHNKRTIFNKHTTWYNQSISGTIKNNFIYNAVYSGFHYNEIHQIFKIMQWTINLHQLQLGDKYAVLLRRNKNKNHILNSYILGIHIIHNNKHYYAFRSQNGSYYNSKIDSLNLDCLSYPTKKKYKTTSGFNLTRIHPITKLKSPHRGIDLAMPIGTPVLAIADGKIINIKYNKIAGNFIIIQHKKNFISRYMHLQKILVKLNQKVKKGTSIALSGNTGRTTGPHLHYELWFHGTALNPNNIKLIQAKHLTYKEYIILIKEIKKIKNLLHIN